MAAPVRYFILRKVRQNFDLELRRFYWDWNKGFWSDGYAIDSVGFAPLDVLKQYVQNQGKDRLRRLRSVAQLSHPDLESEITRREFPC